MYKGIRVVGVENSALDSFFENGKLEVSCLPMNNYYPNECIVLKSSDRLSGLGTIKNDYIININENLSISGISAKNKEQRFAISLLNDPTIQVVTLSGVPGGGKSLLSLASALSQSFGKNALYEKILYIKSLETVGPSIGFLPGTVAEKVMPFMEALRDSIKICKIDKDIDKLTGMDEKSKIQITPISFLRGRTLRRCFVVLDEAQNYSTHELHTVLTRLDEASKIAIIGDTLQADVDFRQEDRGFSRIIEEFKDSDLFAHVEFIKSQRSRLAQLVSERLG
ncbi:MAG: PhoH family protein [Flavobacteriales bacterium]|nr:PhoH family protein [Flavobacteriales bacterium]